MQLFQMLQAKQDWWHGGVKLKLTFLMEICSCEAGGAISMQWSLDELATSLNLTRNFSTFLSAISKGEPVIFLNVLLLLEAVNWKRSSLPPWLRASNDPSILDPFRTLSKHKLLVSESVSASKILLGVDPDGV